MAAFRKRKVRVLAVTEVASRGIDVSDLTHVINYGLPQDPESYVHRIGRAGKQGRAITLVGPHDERKMRAIERLTRKTIHVETEIVSDIHPPAEAIGKKPVVSEKRSHGRFKGKKHYDKRPSILYY